MTTRVPIGGPIEEAVIVAAARWQITPGGAAQRLIREGLQAHGFLPPPAAHRTVRLPGRWIERISQLAEQHGMKRSDIVRRLLAQGISTHPTSRLNIHLKDPRKITLRIPADLDDAVQDLAGQLNCSWAAAAATAINVSAQPKT